MDPDRSDEAKNGSSDMSYKFEKENNFPSSREKIKFVQDRFFPPILNKFAK